MQYTAMQIDQALDELKSGDNQALSRLYDYTHKQLFALCVAYLHNRQDGEDALHDTYVAVKRSILSFKGKKGFNWIYTIAKNVCLNKLKRGAREELLDMNSPTAENLAVTTDVPLSDSSGILQLARETLSEQEFLVVTLHAISGYGFGEIAALTHRIEATVRWQYGNAIKKLRKNFERISGDA